MNRTQMVALAVAVCILVMTIAQVQIARSVFQIAQFILAGGLR